MKKSIFLAVAAVAMTACSNDVDLGMKDANKQTADNAIGFSVLDKNMSRAYLQDKGHYNFGVFAYKQVDASNYQQIMDGYLVGYLGPNVGYKQLSKTTNDGLKYDDPTGSQSKWAYEGLGTKQYNHTENTSDEHYYTTTTDTKYMSNFEYQYLRYWDLSANHVNFFAYAPYVNGANKVTYDNSTHTMTFPMGSIKDGVDDPSLFEYMYASKQVATTDYKKAVSLSFKRMNAKVNIAFYEDVAGYEVILEKLVDGTVDISAAPATWNGTNHVYSNGLRKTAGAAIEFTGSDYTDATVTNDYTGSDVYTSGEYLKFVLPSAHEAIGTTKGEALGTKKNSSYSQTTYYAIPKEDTNDCGLTFHVSFTLKSTTDETIKVQDARVYVPHTVCKWEANKAYTYIFKITKNTSGTTVSDPDIKPYDPTVPGNALFPIVFDNCVVENWTNAADSEHPIN